MATIATLTQKTDGSLEGTLATLNVTAQIAIVPNGRKAKENEPDFRCRIVLNCENAPVQEHCCI